MNPRRAEVYTTHVNIQFKVYNVLSCVRNRFLFRVSINYKLPNTTTTRLLLLICNFLDVMSLT